jgi:hypothetical protein
MTREAGRVPWSRSRLSDANSVDASGLSRTATALSSSFRVIAAQRYIGLLYGHGKSESVTPEKSMLVHAYIP